MTKAAQQYYNFSSEELHNLLIRAKEGSLREYNKISAEIRSIAFSYFKSKYDFGKLNSIDDAEDLATEIFISFSKQFKNIENIERWLRRVMFLSFVNFYKREKSRLTYEFKEDLIKESSEDQKSSGFDKEIVMKIVNSLKNPKREIIHMRFWDGMQFNEIAVKLNRNEAAVKKMFYRTMEEIKKRLE